MVGTFDATTKEIRNCRLRLVDELVLNPQKHGTEFYVHLELPSRSVFFRVGYSEYVFISLLDGETTLAEALAIMSQKLGPDAISEQEALELLKWLLKNELAVSTDGSSIAARAQSQSSLKTSKFRQRLNPFWTKLPLGTPDKFLDTLYQRCQPLFHPAFHMLCWAAIGVAGFLVFGNWEQFRQDSLSIFAPSNWLYLIVGWAMLKVIHEFAHAITCKHFGGEVRETGIILILFAPMAYVDVTSSWRFTSKWKRIAVAFAGIYAELIVASLCVFLWRNSPSQWLSYQLVNLIVTSTVATFLFNGNPLMRFDGYFILSDLLGIPNLYEHGTKSVSRWTTWLFLGRTQKNTQSRHSRWAVSVYGVLAVAWRIVMCVSLVIAASAMFEGAGIILSLVGIGLWLIKPMWQVGVRFARTSMGRPAQLIRAGAVTMFLLTLGFVSWFAIPNPFVAQTPCLVAYQDSTKVRANTAGFVEEIFVENGQTVKVGDKLLTLRNDELVVEAAELEAELKQAITQERIATEEGNPSAAQVARAQQISCRQELAQHRRRIDDLIMRADKPGQVVANRLSERLGTYVSEGDTLLSVAGDGSKELHLFLDADVASRIGDVSREQKELRLKLGTRQSITVALTKVDPRAKKKGVNPKLLSPYGGTIAVREAASSSESNKEQFETLKPCFRAIAELPDELGSELRSGERGVAFMGDQNSSLGKWLFNRSRNWLRTQIKSTQPNNG